MPLLKKTDLMEKGERLTVRSGEFAGLPCTIVDPTPYPDDDLNRRRKIDVVVHTDHGDEEVCLLPRVIDDGGRFDAYLAQQHAAPVTPTTPPAPVPAQAPAPVVVPPPAVLPTMEQPVVIMSPITDVDDPRLDPYRPDPAVVDRYISRRIEGLGKGISDTDFLLTFFKDRENVMLVGDTQAGKTMMVQVLAVLAGRQRAKDRGDADWENAKPLPVFTLSGSSGVTDFDLFGQVTAFTDPLTGRESLVWLPGLVDMAVRAGGILYLDEVNMMGERVTSSLHPVCDYRRQFVNRQKAVPIEVDGTLTFVPDVVQASDDLWIVGTVNPGYKGAGAMNEAFTGRFQWVPWGYDEAVENRLIPYQTVRLIGEALRQAREGRAISTPVGSGTLAQVCKNVDRFGAEVALWMLVSLFQPGEQAAVEEILTARSFHTMLDSERDQRTATA